MNLPEVERLWHVSDDGRIERFIPREPPERAKGVSVPVVWAVSTARLPNYLVPRDCPRVTFYRCSTTLRTDIERFNVPDSGQVVVVDERWLPLVGKSEIWLYELPNAGFRCLDKNAGYFVHESEVRPLSKTRLTDLPFEIAFRGAQ
ncbi:MAG: DUF6886 family protein, partial [Casimicrobium sp.]